MVVIKLVPLTTAWSANAKACVPQAVRRRLTNDSFLSAWVAVASADTAGAFCASNAAGHWAGVLSVTGRLLLKSQSNVPPSRMPDRMAHEFSGGKDHEPRHDISITAPQAARFRAQPKQPFKPISLHPDRRLTLRPRQKIERGTHPYHDRRLNAAEMARHPELLLGCAQPHPYYMRPRHVDGRNDRAVLLRR